LSDAGKKFPLLADDSNTEFLVFFPFEVSGTGCG